MIPVQRRPRFAHRMHATTTGDPPGLRSGRLDGAHASVRALGARSGGERVGARPCSSQGACGARPAAWPGLRDDERRRPRPSGGRVRCRRDARRRDAGVVVMGRLARHPAADVPRGLRRGDRPRRDRPSRAVPDLPARTSTSAQRAARGRRRRGRPALPPRTSTRTRSRACAPSAPPATGSASSATSRMAPRRRSMRLGLTLDLVAVLGELGRAEAGPAVLRPDRRGAGPAAGRDRLRRRPGRQRRPAGGRGGMTAIFLRRGPWGWIQAGRRRPARGGRDDREPRELPAALASAGLKVARIRATDQARAGDRRCG